MWVLGTLGLRVVPRPHVPRLHVGPRPRTLGLCVSTRPRP